MKPRKGFTLLELMLGIAISSIIMTALVVPQISMVRARMRIETVSLMHAELDNARDFISGEIRECIPGVTTMLIDDAQGNNDNEVIRIGTDIASLSMISLNNDNELIFSRPGEDEICILTDVTQFNTAFEANPINHIRYDITMERNGNIVHREFMATGRSQVEND